MTIIKLMTKDDKNKLANERHKRFLMYSALLDQREIAIRNNWTAITISVDAAATVVRAQMYEIDQILKAAR